MTRVSIVKANGRSEDEIFRALKHAVDLVGGIENYVKAGDRVLLKPNFVRPAPPPTTTDIRVVKAVAKLVKGAGGKPVIGEGTAAMTLLWREEMTSKDVLLLVGAYRVAGEVGCEVSPFEDESGRHYTKVKIPGGILLREAKIADEALRADVIIPIPVMKCSMEGGGVTLCIKDLHALVDPLTDRLKHHRSDLWQKLVDILKAVRDKVKLCIVDGLKAMEGDGPIYGDPVDMGVLLAGDDPVATDAVGAAVMGFDHPIREIGPIGIAYSQGLGEANLEKIEVLGEPISNVRKRLKRASCEIIEGIFPNIIVLEGGTCRACKAWAKFTLYALRGEGILEKVPEKAGKLVFIMGLDPAVPDDPESLLDLGLPIVWGDCALFSTKHRVFWQLREKALYVPGCPPLAVGHQARRIKKFLGFKETGREAWGFLPTYTYG